LAPITLPVKDPSTGITAYTLIDDSDIVRFIPTSLGTNPTGTYELYFDGSDVGLNVDNADENVDAIAFTPDGRLVISTSGSFSVPGLPTNVSGADEDLIVFNPNGAGSETKGTWAMYYDGSDMGLYDGGNAEDVNGAMISHENGNVFLSTLGNFSVPGVTGDGADIFVCMPSSLGSKTACTAYAPFFDGSIHGLDATSEVIDDFMLR
jgi:secreted PhoX family phosphatase